MFHLLFLVTLFLHVQSVPQNSSIVEFLPGFDGPLPFYLQTGGDHDMAVSFQSTQAWIKFLNYHIIDDWRPWMVNEQVGGYTRSYSNHMTYATIKGGGHTAPEDRPEESFHMFKRWIYQQPL